MLNKIKGVNPDVFAVILGLSVFIGFIYDK